MIKNALWQKWWHYTLSVIVFASLTLTALLIASFLLPFFTAISPIWNTSAPTDINASSIFKIALYTIEVALVSTIIAITIGLPCAFFCAKRDFFGKRFLLSLAAIPLCMPPLLIALGFVLVFGMQGFVNDFLKSIFSLEESPIRLLYSFWGIVIAQGFYNFPLIMKTCSDIWKRLPQEQAEAARLLGASEKRIFCTVTIHQLLPSLLSSSVLVFLYCFFSFLIVLLFGVVGSTTLEVAVYQASRTSLDFRQASLLALIETGIALFLVFLWMKLEKNSKKNTGMSFGKEEKIIKKIGIKERPFFIGLFSLVFLFFLFPLASIFYKAFSGPYFINLFLRESFWTSLFNTITVGLASASISVIVAVSVTCFVKAIDPYSKHPFYRLLPLLPMAVSSVVMGFGMTMLFSRSSALVLVLAQSALAWPLAFKQISATIDRIPIAKLEAARMLSSNRFDSVFRVQIPMCKQSIISAFGFCFAISSADAVLPLVLAIPRFDTLALFTYRLAGAYRFNEACASGIILLALSAGIFYWNKQHDIL